MTLTNRFAFAIFGLVLAVAVPAQPPARQGPQRVVLDVVVAPKSGAPVTGLQQQDFTLLDNGVTRPIATFAAFTRESPVEVILVVDAVNTGFQNIATERAQIGTFLKSDGGRLAHPTTLAILTDTGMQMQPDFTSDGNALSASLDQSTIGLRAIRRESDWGAEEQLQISLNAFHTLAAKVAPHPGRKIILWVSPGWPLLSGPNIDFGAKQAQHIYDQVVGLSTILLRGGITIYAIDPLGAGEDVERVNHYEQFLKGVNKPGDVQLGNLALQAFAVESGGLALGPSNDITHFLERCVADTTAYYELSYDPPPPDRRNEVHNLQIKVSQPGLTARTRTLYYSEP